MHTRVYASIATVRAECRPGRSRRARCRCLWRPDAGDRRQGGRGRQRGDQRIHRQDQVRLLRCPWLVARQWPQTRDRQASSQPGLCARRVYFNDYFVRTSTMGTAAEAPAMPLGNLTPSQLQTPKASRATDAKKLLANAGRAMENAERVLSSGGSSRSSEAELASLPPDPQFLGIG